MSIAYDYLTDLQKAQLKTLRPDIFGYPACKRCGFVQVIAGECLQCGCEHDREGNLLEPEDTHNINLQSNARHSYKRGRR